MLNHVVWMTISHLLSRGSIILSGMLVARYLDQTAFSSYSYLLLTATMIAIYSAMGIGITTTKYYAKLETQKESTPIATLGLLNLILAIITVVLFFIFNKFIVPYNLHIPIVIMGAVILCMTLDIYSSNALIGLEKFRQLAYVSIFSTIINLLSVGLAIYNKNIIYSMGGLALSAFVQFSLNISCVVVNLRKLNLFSILTIRYQHTKEIFKTIGPMLFVSLIAASGTWVIGRFILLDYSKNALEQFALYSIGLQWYSIALFLPTMISKVILPKLIKTSHKSSIHLLRKNCWIVFGICFSFAICGLFAQPLISAFYGEKYDIPKGLIFAYLCAATLSAPANIIGNTIIANNKEFEWLLIVICSFLTNLAISYFTLDLGAWMGALALSLSSLMLLILASFMIRARIYA